ncbi:hypothetical protein [Jeongeupia chitinilytica]|uniref:Uncharacterized protein n=1 Tax=Jeongeupia chitinilytica TaxID=1041641 RepID=A0ABQ3H101_9NEIS|nr:hypothetical protein [Jeongeupia chitinilytica]GHD60457.1 hypothetical protein GCM10007350_13520 [Jeongeupia chitinilytica]
MASQYTKHPKQTRSDPAARAALEALFSGSSPAPTPDHTPTLEGQNLIAHKQNEEAAVTAKLERLKRKRETQADIQKAIEAAGFSVDEMRQLLANSTGE